MCKLTLSHGLGRKLRRPLHPLAASPLWPPLLPARLRFASRRGRCQSHPGVLARTPSPSVIHPASRSRAAAVRQPGEAAAAEAIGNPAGRACSARTSAGAPRAHRARRGGSHGDDSVRVARKSGKDAMPELPTRQRSVRGTVRRDRAGRFALR